MNIIECVKTNSISNKYDIELEYMDTLEDTINDLKIVYIDDYVSILKYIDKNVMVKNYDNICILNGDKRLIKLKNVENDIYHGKSIKVDLNKLNANIDNKIHMILMSLIAIVYVCLLYKSLSKLNLEL